MSTASSAGSASSAGTASSMGTATSMLPQVSASGTIPPTGGQLSLEGATFTFPAGAVSTASQITITRTTLGVPLGYTAYSPVYRFEPEGLVFQQPVTVSIPFQGNASRAALFWSRQNSSTAYQRLGGSVTMGAVKGSVTHFSTGFVGDGVQYTDPVDRSCVVTRLLEGRTVTPSNVALFFSVDDCNGSPITGLTDADFVIKEDGMALGSEAARHVSPQPGVQVFASLVLDLSSSTRPALANLIQSARTFVSTLLVDQGLPVQISIEVFAGENTLTEFQRPTLDAALLLQKLDSLATYSPADPASTNLHGAVLDGLTRLDAAQAAFRSRNAGGAFTSGYLILFTDGDDTAGIHTLSQAQAAVAASSNRVMAVGFGAEIDPATLALLAPAGVLQTPTAEELDRDFSRLANHVAGQFSRTYLLTYCSPKRSGMHVVSAEVAGSAHQGVASQMFSASGFGPGCSITSLENACTNLECGGLGCGACDDRTSTCNMQTLKCDNACSASLQMCGAFTITNPNGYSQMCGDPLRTTMCGTTCVDTNTSVNHCGGCSRPCPASSTCNGGMCECPSGLTLCGSACVNKDINTQHCGMCGHTCDPYATCSSGMCECPANRLDCGGVCKDPVALTSCGGCSSTCMNNGNETVACQRDAMTQVPACIHTCTANHKDCNTMASDGCEADLMNDPMNCGDCHVPCPGTACVNGACLPAPVVLTTILNTRSVDPIISGSDLLYILGGASQLIYKVPLAGGTPTVHGTGFYAAHMIRAGAYLWGTNDAIWRAPLAGGAGINIWYDMAMPSDSVTLNMTTDGTYLYWSQDHPAANTVDFLRMRLDSTTPTVIGTVPSAGIKSLETDGVYLYFGRTDPPSQALMRLPCTGGAAEVLLSGVNPQFIHLSGSTLFWVDYDTHLKSASVSGGAVTNVVPEQILATDFFVDATDIVYGKFINSTYAGLVKRSRSTGVEIDYGQMTYPTSITGDATHIIVVTATATLGYAR